MCCDKNKCVITTSVVTSSSEVALPTSINDRIKGRRVMSLMIPRSGSNTLFDDAGRTQAADTVMAGVHLILKDYSGQEIMKIPAWSLLRDFNAPNPFPIDAKDIDLTQSLFKINTAASGYNAAHVIQLVIGYDCTTCAV